MSRVSAVVAVGALVLAVVLGGAPGARAATTVPVPAQGGTTTPSSAPAPSTSAGFVQLTVSTVSPSVLTPSTTSVTVGGQLRNVGDRSVADLEVRLQRGAALTGTAAVGAALDQTPEATEALGRFTPVAATLTPGQTADFSVSVPVGRVSGGLGLSAAGVYPVLVNLNGQPDFGDTARLDSAHFLLPVQVGTTGAGSPQPLTLLWPLADRPRLLPVPPGAAPELSDDDLATSFAPGGRLRGLLQALVDARAGSTALGSATCLAVDPDLLATVEVMTGAGGYRVRTATGTTAGIGAAAASTWLAQLRSVAAGSCVTALPWAQADLDAAAAAGLDQVERTVTAAGPAEVARLLGTDTLPTLTWPSTGTLSPGAATALRSLGQTAVLLPGGAVTGAGTDAAVRTSGGLAAVLADPTATQALAATGADAPTPTTAATTVLGSTAAGQSGPRRVLALQDATAALLAPSLDADPTTDRVVLAPPQRWGVDAQEAAALLATVGGMLDDGTATAAPLATVVRAAAASTTTATVATTVAGSTPASTTAAAAAGVESSITGFLTAAQTDVQAQVQPADLVAALRQDLVRSVSATGRGPAPAAVGAALAAMLGEVSLQDQAGVFTLASEQSPLLLVVRNPLPVAVDVQVTVTGPPGLRVQDTGVQQLPAGSSRQLVLPTSVGRTGQFAVDVSLRTSSGQPIGDPTRVLVRSTAYGTLTAALTLGAAGLLVLLVARRLWHRFRGEPDRADDGRGHA